PPGPCVPEFLALGLASGEPKPNGGHEGGAKTWHAACRRVNNGRKTFAGKSYPLRRRAGAKPQCGFDSTVQVGSRLRGNFDQNPPQTLISPVLPRVAELASSETLVRHQHRGR